MTKKGQEKKWPKSDQKMTKKVAKMTKSDQKCQK